MSANIYLRRRLYSENKPLHTNFVRQPWRLILFLYNSTRVWWLIYLNPHVKQEECLTYILNTIEANVFKQNFISCSWSFFRCILSWTLDEMKLDGRYRYLHVGRIKLHSSIRKLEIMSCIIKHYLWYLSGMSYRYFARFEFLKGFGRMSSIATAPGLKLRTSHF